MSKNGRWLYWCQESLATMILYWGGRRSSGLQQNYAQKWYTIMDSQFSSVTGASMLQRLDWQLRYWLDDEEKAWQKSKNKGSVIYVNKIETESTGYHYKHFCHITKIWVRTSLQELVDKMKNKSRTVLVEWQWNNLYWIQLYWWFLILGGQDKSPFKKPHLTNKRRGNE